MVVQITKPRKTYTKKNKPKTGIAKRKYTKKATTKRKPQQKPQNKQDHNLTNTVNINLGEHKKTAIRKYTRKSSQSEQKPAPLYQAPAISYPAPPVIINQPPPGQPLGGDFAQYEALRETRRLRRQLYELQRRNEAIAAPLAPVSQFPEMGPVRFDQDIVNAPLESTPRPDLTFRERALSGVSSVASKIGSGIKGAAARIASEDVKEDLARAAQAGLLAAASGAFSGAATASGAGIPGVLAGAAMGALASLPAAGAAVAGSLAESARERSGQRTATKEETRAALRRPSVRFEEPVRGQPSRPYASETIGRQRPPISFDVYNGQRQQSPSPSAPSLQEIQEATERESIRLRPQEANEEVLRALSEMGYNTRTGRIESEVGEAEATGVGGTPPSGQQMEEEEEEEEPLRFSTETHTQFLEESGIGTDKTKPPFGGRLRKNSTGVSLINNLIDNKITDAAKNASTIRKNFAKQTEQNQQAYLKFLDYMNAYRNAGLTIPSEWREHVPNANRRLRGVLPGHVVVPQSGRV